MSWRKQLEKSPFKGKAVRRLRPLLLSFSLLAVPLAQELPVSREGLVASDRKEPVGDEPPLLRFSVVSDIHVYAGEPRTSRKLEAALRDLNDVDPSADALVVNGDLTAQGTQEDYDSMNVVLEAARGAAATFFTMGNHEYYRAWLKEGAGWSPDTFPNGETEAQSQERYLRATGMPALYDDRWIKGHHFIFLSSEQYRQSDPGNGEDAYLSEKQLQFLKEKLGEKEKGKRNGESVAERPIFVFLHQPIPDTVSGSGYNENRRAVIQHEALTEILRGYPQAVFFSGHTHWSLSLPNSVVRSTFTMINTSSVWEPLNEQDQSIGEDASEGVHVQVFADRVVVAGRDFASHQWMGTHTISLPVVENASPTSRETAYGRMMHRVLEWFRR